MERRKSAKEKKLLKPWEQATLGPAFYIQTYTGVRMSPFKPQKSDFRISDIAHALSQMVRANGHFSIFYSVAQHCLNCCYEGEARGYSKRIQLGLLLHDATEAYISDVTRPVKAGFPDYRQMEERLNEVIFEAFGLYKFAKEEKKIIREVDDDMMYCEFAHLHISGGLGKDYSLRQKPDLTFRPMTDVEAEYIDRFQRLINMKETPEETGEAVAKESEE